MVYVAIEVVIVDELSYDWAYSEKTGRNHDNDYVHGKLPRTVLSALKNEEKVDRGHTIGSWEISSCGVYGCSDLEGSPVN